MDLLNQIYEFKKNIKDVNNEKLIEIADIITNIIISNNTIYICGNGGSGSSANLFASLLIQLGIHSNCRVNAISLNSNMVTLSDLAYKYGNLCVFNLQLQATANKNDLLIVISGSGSSPNILEAVKIAKEKGLIIIGFTGLDGGKLIKSIDKIIFAPSNKMEQIENIHYIVIHAIIRLIKDSLSSV